MHYSLRGCMVGGYQGNSLIRLSRKRRFELEPLEGRSLPATFTAFPLPATAQPPANITKGPDGNLWFTDPGGLLGSSGQIGRVTTSGAFTLYPLPSGALISSTSQITAGPDGNLWFTEGTGKIGKITTSGQVQEFTIPKSGTISSTPLGGIAPGPDVNVWFTLAGGIGRFTPGGQITEFPLSVAPVGNITKGADGNLWFTTSKGIGKLTSAGLFTNYPINSAGVHQLQGITVGPDGNIWFLEVVESITSNLEIGKVTSTGQITEYPLYVSSSYLVRRTHDRPRRQLLLHGQQRSDRGSEPELIQRQPGPRPPCL